MASVQELLAAANAQKSPLISGLEGVAQGFHQAQSGALERAKTLIAMETERQNRERAIEEDKNIRATLAGQTEGNVMSSLYNLGGVPAVAGPKKMEKFVQDPKTGLYSRSEVITSGGDTNKLKYGELTQAEQDSVDKAMSEGRLAPAQITRGPKLKSLAQQFIKDPSYDAIAADVSFSGGKSEAQAAGGLFGKKGTELGALVGSLDDTLRQMAPLVSQLPSTSISDVNDAIQKGLAHLNDPAANKLLGLANSARGLYSQVLVGGGAGTVESDKKSNETISRGLNPQGFQGMFESVLAEGYSRTSRLRRGANNAPKEPKGYVREDGTVSGGSKTTAPSSSSKKVSALLDKWGAP
jgi:hypothetical protein